MCRTVEEQNSHLREHVQPGRCLCLLGPAGKALVEQLEQTDFKALPFEEAKLLSLKYVFHQIKIPQALCGRIALRKFEMGTLAAAVHYAHYHLMQAHSDVHDTERDLLA